MPRKPDSATVRKETPYHLNSQNNAEYRRAVPLCNTQDERDALKRLHLDIIPSYIKAVLGSREAPPPKLLLINGEPANRIKNLYEAATQEIDHSVEKGLLTGDDRQKILNLLQGIPGVAPSTNGNGHH